MILCKFTKEWISKEFDIAKIENAEEFSNYGISVVDESGDFIDLDSALKRCKLIYHKLDFKQQVYLILQFIPIHIRKFKVRNLKERQRFNNMYSAIRGVLMR